MLNKKIVLITLLLLAIFSIGAVSAADDVDALSVDDDIDEQVIEAPVSDDDVLADPVPEDFNVVITDNEIDVDDEDATVVSFNWPSYVTANDFVRVDVEGGSGPTFNKEDDPSGKVPFNRLYIFEPGTYNLKVTYNDNLVLATGTLKVTKTYTPDDFIQINPNVDEYERDVVNVWDEEGLNGLVTVYANGAKVYSQNLVAEPDVGVLINVENLTGNYNGQYKIKAVYQKTGGKEYAKEATVTFTGVGTPTKTTIAASPVTTVYNGNKNIVATLKDDQGKAISGAKVSIKVYGVTIPLTTDKNGQVKLSTNGMAVKTHSAVITFAGNDNYLKSTKTIKVTVKKATPKLTAAKKTFKKSVATKKYTITLKDNVGNINKAKVTLKVNGKTYSATTSSGKATFKITNLKKKGTFTAVVTYKGNSYYNAKTVKPKIVVK